MKPIQISIAKFVALLLVSLLGMAFCYVIGFAKGRKRRQSSGNMLNDIFESFHTSSPHHRPSDEAVGADLRAARKSPVPVLPPEKAEFLEEVAPVIPSADKEPSAVLPPQPPSRPAPPWPSTPQSGPGLSSDWLTFVSERLDELEPKDEKTASWALGVVDFIDELKEAEGEASPEEQAVSARLRASLTDYLAAFDYQLLDSDTWSPDKQRAVAVRRSPDATAPRILGKGSTGLARCGKVIRKQEVKLEQPGT